MNKPINLEEQIKNKLREQKNTEYGNYEINFNLLAMLWSVILKNSLHTDIKPHQVAQCMVMLKMLRTTEKFKSDSYLDASIYLDMAKELHKKHNNYIKRYRQKGKSMFKKVRFGNVDFQYIETYDTEENAINGQNGSFIEVTLETPRITRSSITKLKEKSDGSENSFAEAERSATKETHKVSGVKI
jgi:hypothetical protein